MRKCFSFYFVWCKSLWFWLIDIDLPGFWYLHISQTKRPYAYLQGCLTVNLDEVYMFEAHRIFSYEYQDPIECELDKMFWVAGELKSCKKCLVIA